MPSGVQAVTSKETSNLKTSIFKAFPIAARASARDYVSGRGYIDDELIEALTMRRLAVDGTFINYFYNDLPAFTDFGWRQVIGSWLCYAIDHPDGHECQYLIYDLRRRVGDDKVISTLSEEQKRVLISFARDVMEIDDSQLTEMLNEIVAVLSR